MVIVTGASGQLGRAVVARLLERLPPDRVAVSVRDPGKASDLARLGVQVRHGDFDRPDSLEAAFEGATQVLIVSTDTTGEQTLRLHGAAIEAARAAGARQVLYTSHVGAGAESPFPPMPDHAATERMLEEALVPFTSLRHGFYAASALQLMEQGLRTGVLHLPEDGKVSWTTHADLAEADAILLADEGRIGGITPPLTASEAFDMADLAALASELTSRKIERTVVSDEAWRRTLIDNGAPPWRADLLVGLFQAARRGDFEAVDPTLEALLGRRPQTMWDVLATTLKAGAA